MRKAKNIRDEIRKVLREFLRTILNKKLKELGWNINKLESVIKKMEKETNP